MMDAGTKYKLKAFLWDQLVRPLIVFFNLKQVQSISLAFTFLAIILFKSIKLFLIFFLTLLILYAYETVKYYQSGEYLKNYRNHKYPEYRKALKEIRKERKYSPQQKLAEQQQLDTSPEINPEEVPNKEVPIDGKLTN